MKTIEIVIDFSFMTQFEECEDFILFVGKVVKAKHNFKNIEVFNFFGEQIILSGQNETRTIFNLATMASDIMGAIHEYNQTRKEQGKSLFVVDIYAVAYNNGVFSKKTKLCVSNIVQWRK